jgi:dephospho-CoA kinase
MLVIGLTGGIGCGKSRVSELFQQLGVPVIDADRVAREVVEPGQPALAEIRQRFGETVMLPTRGLDRKRLRAIVFQDPQARHDLEQILHPRIRARMQERLASLDTPYAILSIPLLLEAGQQTVDRVLVIDCPPEAQIERVCARDRITPEQAGKIMETQVDRQTRLAAADDLIDNTGPPEALKPQVQALHARYLGIQRTEDKRQKAEDKSQKTE